MSFENSTLMANEKSARDRKEKKEGVDAISSNNSTAEEENDDENEKNQQEKYHAIDFVQAAGFSIAHFVKSSQFFLRFFR